MHMAVGGRGPDESSGMSPDDGRDDSPVDGRDGGGEARGRHALRSIWAAALARGDTIGARRPPPLPAPARRCGPRGRWRTGDGPERAGELRPRLSPRFLVLTLVFFVLRLWTSAISASSFARICRVLGRVRRRPGPAPGPRISHGAQNHGTHDHEAFRTRVVRLPATATSKSAGGGRRGTSAIYMSGASQVHVAAPQVALSPTRLVVLPLFRLASVQL